MVREERPPPPFGHLPRKPGGGEDRWGMVGIGGEGGDGPIGYDGCGLWLCDRFVIAGLVGGADGFFV